MEIFINECSFHEQMHDRGEFFLAAKVFYSIFNSLHHKQVEHRVFGDEYLFNVYKAVRGEILIKSLNNVRDKSLYTALRNILFNKLNARDWEPERLHSQNDVFECQDEYVTDTSMAELCERKLRNNDLLGLLVNFPKSRFENIEMVEITKNSEHSVELDCVENSTGIEEWLEDNLELSRQNYDPFSLYSPLDTQTVLRDQTRFE